MYLISVENLYKLVIYVYFAFVITKRSFLNCNPLVCYYYICFANLNIFQSLLYQQIKL